MNGEAVQQAQYERQTAEPQMLTVSMCVHTVNVSIDLPCH